jgi:hypothetical protein
MRNCYRCTVRLRIVFQKECGGAQKYKDGHP